MLNLYISFRIYCHKHRTMFANKSLSQTASFQISKYIFLFTRPLDTFFVYLRLPLDIEPKLPQTQITTLQTFPFGDPFVEGDLFLCRVSPLRTVDAIDDSLFDFLQPVQNSFEIEPTPVIINPPKPRTKIIIQNPANKKIINKPIINSEYCRPTWVRSQHWIYQVCPF